MQKIIEQELSGNLDQCRAKAQYTWEKDEIAFLFDTTYCVVLKVRFTGERWLSDKGWRMSGLHKIYQYEVLTEKCPNDHRVTHNSEEAFYTLEEEAVQKGIAVLSNKITNLKSEIEKLEDIKQNLTLFDRIRDGEFPAAWLIPISEIYGERPLLAPQEQEADNSNPNLPDTIVAISGLNQIFAATKKIALVLEKYIEHTPGHSPDFQGVNLELEWDLDKPLDPTMVDMAHNYCAFMQTGDMEGNTITYYTKIPSHDQPHP